MTDKEDLRGKKRVKITRTLSYSTEIEITDNTYPNMTDEEIVEGEMNQDLESVFEAMSWLDKINMTSQVEIIDANDNPIMGASDGALSIHRADPGINVHVDPETSEVKPGWEGTGGLISGPTGRKDDGYGV